MPLNDAVAQRLALIARLHDLLGSDKFRAISHDRAARAVESLPEPIEKLVESGGAKRLTEIEGIGPKIAEKIVEFVKSGEIEELTKLSAEVPPGVIDLMGVPGVGPKTASILWKSAGITSLAALKAALEAAAKGEGALVNAPRLGLKTLDKIRSSITVSEQGQLRLPLGVAMIIAEEFVEELKEVRGVKEACYTGSLRRGRDTVGDIDILVCVADLKKDAARAAEAFRAIKRVQKVMVSGDTRSSVMAAIRTASGGVSARSKDPRTKGGAIEELAGPAIQVDLRVLPAESWGAALMYFTGSKDHNVRLRERAIKKGMTLTDYGLFELDEQGTKARAAKKAGGKKAGRKKGSAKAARGGEDGEAGGAVGMEAAEHGGGAGAADIDGRPPHERGLKAVAGKTEEEVYEALGLPYIPPEIRENIGELELKKTPRLIEFEDIKAELHAHTTASDGSLTIEELAREAKRRGFHTVAVTDHSKSSAIAGGLSIERLVQHIENVRKADKAIDGINILAGSEVDILADGSLDYPDEVLKLLDIVVASPHSSQSQAPEVATRRLLRAIENPYVHIIGHPTGRLVNRRPGLSPDMTQIASAAKKHDVALEINAHWARLDLRDTHVRLAVDAGCKIAINCDVHTADDADNLRFGVMTGRRGWLTPELCVNAWGAGKLREWLKSKR